MLRNWIRGIVQAEQEWLARANAENALGRRDLLVRIKDLEKELADQVSDLRSVAEDLQRDVDRLPDEDAIEREVDSRVESALDDWADGEDFGRRVHDVACDAIREEVGDLDDHIEQWCMQNGIIGHDVQELEIKRDLVIKALQDQLAAVTQTVQSLTRMAQLSAPPAHAAQRIVWDQAQQRIRARRVA